MKEKPWSGRFTQETDGLTEDFTASISFDRRLYRHDIQGSIAYCKALAKAGIVSPDEQKQIIQALEEIQNEIDTGQFSFSVSSEDIHMHVERRLREKIGEVGGKLHTGRSRNDQIALDMRLYLKEEILTIIDLVKGLQRTLVQQAADHIDAIMPGYTHLRKAQPILLSHYFMAYFEMFKRDSARLRDTFTRVDVLPLGSGAIAGSPYPIDQHYLADLLGFANISQNSIDAVSDRDFLVEFLADCALAMMHLSRLCEDLIIWSAPEFGFLRLPQPFCTGSSIMPQKQNPDVLELIRAKTGRVYGALLSLCTVLKALPLAYNRDLQEDKELTFDAIDTVKKSLAIMGRLVDGIEVDRDRMKDAVLQSYANATDLADYLVKKGVPFRTAHQIVGNIVRSVEEQKRNLEDLPLAELQSFHAAIEEDVFTYIRMESSIDHRQTVGGTARQRVAQQIERAKEHLSC